ncbi:NAD(P)H-hydrate dehydratase [Anaerococcus sp. Marseille-P3625]|uniref:NAD(P)H-hydrate dehydratase n=1 Tax=Anaerococcus sp. Marseille-P3625 TaxID=1977277 RepID=UPI000C06B768|nr:NAD(P)H-hydrate dehydratase [Anaerococcus sp. Marseille-P3625]
MIGIDIVEIKRFSFKKNIIKIFTKEELDYASSKANYCQSLAGIFAAKEACLKAYGLKISSIIRKKIEIRHINNIPILYIDSVKTNASISISHDGDYAVAVCQISDLYSFDIDKNIRSLLKKRKSDTHKGTYGRIGILGGSPGMAGSIYLSSLASMRSGAGLSYLIAPKSISTILQIKANEQIIKSIDCENFYYSKEIFNEILEKIKDLDVLAIGPGMGKGDGLNKLIDEIIQNTKINLVIDADGLNALSKDLSIIKKRNNIILTPHFGEFSRLTNMSIDEINKDRENIAKEFAKEHKIVLVLKSNHTIVTDGNKIYINKIGNPGMATAGSGDVLTGIIASFMKNLDPYNAAILGVYIHSLAGDIAKIKLGEESLMASDIINNIAEAIKLLR